MYHVGVDIGGTFTDGVLLDEGGTPRYFKTPTTRRDLLEGVRNIVALAAEDTGMSTSELLGQVEYFGIGTTTATNALIERKGARTGLITTRGFADTLLVQRTMGQWAGLSADDLTYYSRRDTPDPLIPRSRILEVTERVDYRGEVIVALDEQSIVQAIDALVAEGVEAIAVSLLWSFRNPDHEQRVREVIAERAPEVFVTLASELAPVIGEYERTATAAVNAYLGPLMRRHFERFEESLKEDGLTGSMRVMNSSGGVMATEGAFKRAVSTLVSGPTGGVLASLRLAQTLGHANVITTDTGGTSFDVSLIVDGQPLIAATSEVGRYHLVEPMLSIEAIGAGGGSIARVEDGALFVGPTSAGAEPGPACYGRGGSEPTVTDADVVLGYIDPEYFLGGRVKLDKDAAVDAVRSGVAEPLGVELHEAALAIKTIADNQMADLVHALTIGKGHDPRDFAIYAYGGAGPTHCHAYGAELSVESIVIPASATVHSAVGVGTADLAATSVRTDLMWTAFGGHAASLDLGRINATFQALEADARGELLAGGAEPDTIRIGRHVDMRYRRQVNELVVPVDGGRLDGEAVGALIRRFDAKYRQRFGEGSGSLEGGVELVTFRVGAKADRPKPKLGRVTPAAHHNGGPPRRKAYFAGYGEVDVAVVRPETLKGGQQTDGPAILEYPGTTVVVGPGQTATTDHFGNTILR